jgi:hypothetical protein
VRKRESSTQDFGNGEMYIDLILNWYVTVVGVVRAAQQAAQQARTIVVHPICVCLCERERKREREREKERKREIERQRKRER